MRRKESEEEPDDKEFTPEQRKRLLKMLEAHERAQDRKAWLWSTIGLWLKWLGAVLATLVAAKVLLEDFINGGGR